MKKNTDWAAVIVALAFIGLVALLFITTMQEMSQTDDFLKVWAAVGPIVGVVTGLIPTYFFQNMAKDSSDRAETNAQTMGEYKGMLKSHRIDPHAGIKTGNKNQEPDEEP
jgi:hypothetical protein